MTSSSPLESARRQARALASAGAWRDVTSLLAPLVAHESDGELMLLYAQARMRCGEEREALAWLRGIEPQLAGADRSAHRRAVNMIGAACLAIGELGDAVRAFDDAFERATEHDDLIVMAHASNNLGAIANMQGRHEAALWHYRLALPTFQRLGKPVELAATYHNLAITFRDVDSLDEADEHELRAIEYATDVAPRFAAMARVGRAELALRRGDAPLAETTARLAADELHTLDDPQNEADATRLIGCACAAQRRYADALAAFDRALAIARERGHTLNEAETLRDRARTHLHRGEHALAVTDTEAAIALFSRLGATTERDALLERLRQLGGHPDVV